MRKKAGELMDVEAIAAFGALTGIGAFTLAILRFAYGAIRDAMKSKDEEIDRLVEEIEDLRNRVRGD